MNGKIEMAFRVPGHERLDVWVSFDDAHRLIMDEFLHGHAFIEPIPDRDPNALVTHRRIAPHLVTA